MHASWHRIAAAYARLCFASPLRVIAVFLILGLAGSYLAITRLEVVTDLGALLPEGTSSVSALDQSRVRIGSTDFFTIAIESGARNADSIARVQDELKKRIKNEWKDALWVQTGRDTEFFRKHALYYLPEKDLLSLKEKLEEELIRFSSKHVPGMVNLLDDDDEEEKEQGGIDDWYDEDLPRRLGLPPQIVEQFNAYFTKKGDQSSDAAGSRPVRSGNTLIGPLGDVGVVLVQLEKPSTDLDYARFALGRGETLIASLNIEKIDPSLKAEVVGAYRSFMEVDAVSDDGLKATAVSVSLVLVLMFLFFRSFRTVVVVFVPLAVAGAVTMGITALLYGRLTVLTVFVLAMLVGMGIDYGIHLFGRMLIESRSGIDMEQAAVRSIRGTGTALLVAAATTIISLMALQFGHFEGFREFSIVASYGLLICVLFNILMIPAIVALLERIRPAKIDSKFVVGADHRVRPLNSAAGGPHAEIVGLPAEGPAKAGPRALSAIKWMFVSGLVIALILSFGIPSVAFEHDFRNLRAPGTGASIGYGRAIGRDASTTPAVILGSDRVQMQKVHDLLLERMNVEKDPTLKSFITFFTFVPPHNLLEARQKIIREIREIIHKKAFNRAEGDRERLVKELRSMSESEPFDEHDLPDWALRVITEKNGSTGLIGHLYARVQDWDYNSVRRFHKRYGNLEIDGQRVPVANSRFILSDVVTMVKRDGRDIAMAASAGLILVLILFARSIRGIVVLGGVMASAALCVTGLMGFMGVRPGLYNIITIPVILGVGIDSATHLYHRHTASDRPGVWRNLRTTGLTITAGSFTTMAGFAGLMFVSHLGLRSIGIMAVIGVGVTWLVMILLMPFLLGLIPQGKEPRQEV